MADAVTVRVSGKTYWAALDPKTTDVPGECGWPAAEVSKVGKGQRWTYLLSREQVEEMREHLHTVGYSLAHYSDDPDSRAEGRSCLKDAQRLADLQATLAPA